MSSNVRAVVSWRQRQKRKVIEYLGGACILCGYDTTPRSMEVHHVNPKEKSFGISSGGNTRAWDKVVDELDKCVLLCSNCHGEVHDGIVDMSILSEALLNDLSFRRERAETIMTNSDLGFPQIKSKNFCSCGQEITYGATRCLSCYRATRSAKIDWPDLEVLLDMISEKGYSQVGRELGVSDNAVRKHIKTKRGMG